MAAADLATQEARASAAMLLTQFNRDDSVLARWGLTFYNSVMLQLSSRDIIDFIYVVL